MRLLLLLIALVIVAPMFAPRDPMRTNTEAARQPPSIVHVLGTDALGRDVWSRLAFGGQRTFGTAALASVIALLPGIAVGLLLNAAPRRAGLMAQTFITAILAFPQLIFALVVVTLIGQGGLALAIGITQIAPTARVVYSATLPIRVAGYVESARALGAPPMHMLRAHILPNVAPTVLAYAGVVFSYSLLNSAALSFLGLGGEPGVPDWGVMLAEGRQAFRSTPWVALASGVAITVSIMIINHAADQLHQRR